MHSPLPHTEHELRDLVRRQAGKIAALEHEARELEQRNALLAARLAQQETELLEHRRNHEEWEWVFERALDLLIIHDADGMVLRVSPSVTPILGFTPDEFVRLGVPCVVHPDDLLATTEHMSRAASRTDGTNHICRIRHKDGSWRWLAWTSPAPRYHDGQLCRTFAVGRDITASKLTEQELLHRAQHDALTGLANRACFDQALDAALLRAARSGGSVALLLIDLDGFKAVNDGLGHQAGDAVLVAVAQRLRTAQRQVDLVARLGGDEFGCLVEGATAIALKTIAERIQSAIAAPIQLHTTEVGIGCSIGIATWQGGADDARSLFDHADKAMYAVKAQGKRGYAFYGSTAPVPVGANAAAPADLNPSP